MKDHDVRYQRMLKIQKRYGSIEPDYVIEDARDEKSPFHDDFNWDVEAVAMQAWRQTARRIIREFKFEKVVRNVTILSPLFRHDPQKGKEQGYVMMPETVHERKENLVKAELARAYGICNSSWQTIAGMDFDDDEQALADIEERLSKVVEELEILMQVFEKEAVAV
jgi:hypothetical protein